MKRTLLLINLLLLSVCVFPQENIEVNYATIKKYVENQSDDYQQLIERFEANDSLLSLNDYALSTTVILSPQNTKGVWSFGKSLRH